MHKLTLWLCAAITTSMTMGCADPVQAPGPALVSIDAPPPTRAIPGEELPPITIRLADANGTPHPGRRVLVEGDGTFDTSDSVTDGSGRLTITWTLPLAEGVADPPKRFGLEGVHSLRVRTLDGEVDERYTTTVAWFRADQVDASWSYGCAIAEAALWCFGRPPERLVAARPDGQPVRLTLPAGVVPAEVRLNNAVVCVRNAVDGRPWCLTNYNGPPGFRDVPNAPAFVEIVDAGRRFCGRSADGMVSCWGIAGGLNEDGAISPAIMVDTMRFAALAGQARVDFSYPTLTRACALDMHGAVWCWGDNVEGFLGAPAPQSSLAPVRVPLPVQMTAVSVGVVGACATAVTVESWCWGDWFGGGDFAPRRIVNEGPAGSIVIPGHWELFELWPGNVRTHYRSQRYDQFPGFATFGRGLTELVNEGQACGRTATRAVFCSWILLRGGSETSLLTAALIPVPAP